MYIVNEEDKEYRFGDSGPKYLMKGPRMNFALVQFQAGQDFKAHYHNVMEENFYILEGEVDIVVDGVVNHLRPGQMIHIEPGEIHYVINNSGAPMKMISTLAPYTNPDKVDVENYTYYGKPGGRWGFAPNPRRELSSLHLPPYGLLRNPEGKNIAYHKSGVPVKRSAAFFLCYAKVPAVIF